MICHKYVISYSTCTCTEISGTAHKQETEQVWLNLVFGWPIYALEILVWLKSARQQLLPLVWSPIEL